MTPEEEQNLVEDMREAHRKGMRDNIFFEAPDIAMEAALSVAKQRIRDSTIDEVASRLSKLSVKITGTPYECGPREWCNAIRAMKGPQND